MIAFQVISSPYEFFREMPREGGYRQPLLFMVVMALVSGVLQALLSFAGYTLVEGMEPGFGSIIILPIAVAVFGFVGAAILFVVWKLMGSVENYETAYRCIAYISALSPFTTVLGVIPFFGGTIGVAICIYYLVIASVEVHELRAVRAWIVFGVIGAVVAFGGVMAETQARELAQEAADIKSQAVLQDLMVKARQKSEEVQRKAEEAMQQQLEMQQQAYEQEQQGYQQVQQPYVVEGQPPQEGQPTQEEKPAENQAGGSQTETREIRQ